MSDRSVANARARKHLDYTLRHLKGKAKSARPRRGWVRAIRDALGMTTRQLAARMDLSQSTVIGLERGEMKGTVTLNTLRNAAEALDCRLVYALVPNASLEETVRKRASELADARLARVHHTMRLEDQALGKEELAQERERLIRSYLEGRPSRLWEEA